jgi:flagellar biosynthesis protein FliP
MMPALRSSFLRSACAPLPLLLVAAAPLWARSQAAPGFSLPGLLPGASAPGSSASWNIVLLLTLLTMIPAIVLSMTPFVRLLIVFHFLRQALGTQTAPSNQTLIGLSLILTFFLMQPVGAAIYSDAIVPLDEGHITMMAALDRSIIPMRHFMLKYAREKDLALFVELAHEPRPARPEDLALRVVAPAYLLSELQAGFRIGAALFFPFLVIDMVTAAVTTSIGMMQLPPVIISTPLKILLFVVVDGWNLLVGSLMRSFS